MGYCQVLQTVEGRKVVIDKWGIHDIDAGEKFREHTKNSKYIVWANVWGGFLKIQCDDIESGPTLVLAHAVVPWEGSYYVYEEMQIAHGCVIFPAEVEERK